MRAQERAAEDDRLAGLPAFTPSTDVTDVPPSPSRREPADELRYGLRQIAWGSVRAAALGAAAWALLTLMHWLTGGEWRWLGGGLVLALFLYDLLGGSYHAVRGACRLVFGSRSRD